MSGNKSKKPEIFRGPSTSPSCQMTTDQSAAEKDPASKASDQIAFHQIVFSGSFDPITRGHISLIQRVLPRFEKLHIVVANGVDKKMLFSLDERCTLVQKSLQDVGCLSPLIKICKWEGLLVDYCRQYHIPSLLRGVRSVEDLKFEKTMAVFNSKLNAHVETFFLLADPLYKEISSTAVKELAKVCPKEKQLEKFVTKSVSQRLREVTRR